MKKVAVLSSSVRTGRLSHRIALFLQRYLQQNGLADVELLDLKAYDFPLFDERFAFQEHPSEKLVDFTARLFASDALIVVSPVYNADYPAALKNVVDLYFREWSHKVVGVVSVTSGKVPGIATVQKVQGLLTKLGALVAPVLCTVVSAGETFGEDGTPLSQEHAEGLLGPMISELMWLADRTEQA